MRPMPRAASAISPRDIYEIAEAAGMSADEVAELLRQTGRASDDVLSPPPPALFRNPEDFHQQMQTATAALPGPPRGQNMWQPEQPLRGPAPSAALAERISGYSPWADEVYATAAELDTPPALVAAWVDAAHRPAGIEGAAFNIGMRAGAAPEEAYVVGLYLLGAAGTAGAVALGPTPGEAETNQLANSVLWR